jgi:hypothetical protein
MNVQTCQEGDAAGPALSIVFVIRRGSARAMLLCDFSQMALGPSRLACLKIGLTEESGTLS